jgi:hypothetical protein
MAPRQHDRAPGRRPKEDVVRILIDLSRKDAGVEGVVWAEGSDPSARFSGWLELMALLDALWIRNKQERSEG